MYNPTFIGNNHGIRGITMISMTVDFPILNTVHITYYQFSIVGQVSGESSKVGELKNFQQFSEHREESA